MNSLQDKSSEIFWQLSGFEAQLQALSLTARLNLQHPAQGLGGIAWDSVSRSGSVLGIGLDQGASEQGLSIGAGFDCFVRGADLVARFTETPAQPFSIEVYWRVGVAKSSLVQVDAIVSLQTSLLESYPSAQTVTSLHAKEAWFVPGSDKKARRISPGQQLASNEFAGVLLCGAMGSWSYLEMTHPDDLGTWQADGESENWTLQRSLGGEFQEKGVIRRIRVRGVFLPCEGDLDIAPRLLADFASSRAPLTA